MDFLVALNGEDEVCDELLDELLDDALGDSLNEPVDDLPPARAQVREYLVNRVFDHSIVPQAGLMMNVSPVR